MISICSSIIKYLQYPVQYGINRPKQLKTNAHVVIQIMHPINPCQKVVTL